MFKRILYLFLRIIVVLVEILLVWSPVDAVLPFPAFVERLVDEVHAADVEVRDLLQRLEDVVDSRPVLVLAHLELHGQACTVGNLRHALTFRVVALVLSREPQRHLLACIAAVKHRPRAFLQNLLVRLSVDVGEHCRLDLLQRGAGRAVLPKINLLPVGVLLAVCLVVVTHNHLTCVLSHRYEALFRAMHFTHISIVFTITFIHYAHIAVTGLLSSYTVMSRSKVP